MRIKTSLTLSEETLAALDAARDAHTSRSELIERAIAEFLARRARAERDRREQDTIDAHADELNAEMADVLAFQVDG